MELKLRNALGWQSGVAYWCGAWANARLIVGCSRGKILLVNPDNGAAQTVFAGNTTEHVYGIARKGGAKMVVAVTRDGTALVSRDYGRTFKRTSTPATASRTSLHTVTWDPLTKLWTIAGLKMFCAQTSDFKTWTVIPPPDGPAAGKSIYALATAPGGLIAGLSTAVAFLRGGKWTLLPPAGVNYHVAGFDGQRLFAGGGASGTAKFVTAPQPTGPWVKSAADQMSTVMGYARTSGVSVVCGPTAVFGGVECSYIGTSSDNQTFRAVRPPDISATWKRPVYGWMLFVCAMGGKRFAIGGTRALMIGELV